MWARAYTHTLADLGEGRGGGGGAEPSGRGRRESGWDSLTNFYHMGSTVMKSECYTQLHTGVYGINTLVYTCYTPR